MKTPTYILILFVFTILSCSVDNINDEFTTEYIQTIDNAERTAFFPMEDNVCNRVALMTEDHVEIGVVDYAISFDQIIISYKTNDDYKMIETNLSLIDPLNSEFPMDINGSPLVYDFEYSNYDNYGYHEMTYTINMEEFADFYSFAAHALVVGPKNMKERAWASGNTFNENSNATYTQINIQKCGGFETLDQDEDDEEDDDENNEPQYEFCNDNETKVYICHNGNTICVSVNAIDAHLAHGDQLGQCND